MSLARYTTQRMVILSPRSTAYEAARAMADNHIGAVLVSESQKLCGVVTDRDLALDVVAGGLDPKATPLHDVMSDELATADLESSIEDAVRTMCAAGCRRVPITHEGKPVGLVTLDDLLTDGVIDAKTAGEVIAAQLVAAARFKPQGRVHPIAPARPETPAGRARTAMRHRARADTAHARFIRAVERHTGIEDHARAEQALTIVLGCLCRRVLPDEGRHLVAQLPSKMHPLLAPYLDGPDKSITIDTIHGALKNALGVDDAGASIVLTSVCDAIGDAISAGEIEALRVQLPLAMKDLLPPTPLRKTG